MSVSSSTSSFPFLPRKCRFLLRSAVTYTDSMEPFDKLTSGKDPSTSVVVPWDECYTRMNRHVFSLKVDDDISSVD